jgi:hypothetical protein
MNPIQKETTEMKYSTNRNQFFLRVTATTLGSAIGAGAVVALLYYVYLSLMGVPMHNDALRLSAIGILAIYSLCWLLIMPHTNREDAIADANFGQAFIAGLTAPILVFIAIFTHSLR